MIVVPRSSLLSTFSISPLVSKCVYFVKYGGQQDIKYSPFIFYLCFLSVKKVAPPSRGGRCITWLVNDKDGAFLFGFDLVGFSFEPVVDLVFIASRQDRSQTQFQGIV